MAEKAGTLPGSSEPGAYEFDPAELRLRVDETIRGEAGAVPEVVERIMAAVGEMGYAQGQEFEIRLALSEALANAVVHGCGGDPQKKVQVCVECDPVRGMLVVVRDPGPGFDPLKVPSPIDGARVYSGGGRGIFLINRLMDEVRYNRLGTEIRMRKHDAAPRPSAEAVPEP